MITTADNLILSSNLIALAIYGCASFYFIFKLWRQHSLDRRALLITTSIALVFHTIGVFGVSFHAKGFHLSYFGVSSLIFWAMNLLLLASSIQKALHNLFLVLYPLTALSILATLINQPKTLPELMDYSIASHVVLSILAYSLLTIASLQALLLAYQNRQLKNKQLTAGIRLLPPLQTIEVLMFELLWVGEIMLTLAIASGFWFLEDMFAQHLVHKTVFSILAWAIYALLLWGRWKLGWRGNKATRWALAGFVFLMLAYFGSRLVLEMILHRV
jgi:ABC-type uncharacterized transport system permease subunit